MSSKTKSGRPGAERTRSGVISSSRTPSATRPGVMSRRAMRDRSANRTPTATTMGWVGDKLIPSAASSAIARYRTKMRNSSIQCRYLSSFHISPSAHGGRWPSEMSPTPGAPSGEESGPAAATSPSLRRSRMSGRSGTASGRCRQRRGPRGRAMRRNAGSSTAAGMRLVSARNKCLTVILPPWPLPFGSSMRMRACTGPASRIRSAPGRRLRCRRCIRSEAALPS